MNIGIDIDDTLVDTTRNFKNVIGKYDKSGDIEKYIEEILSGEIPTENIRKFMNTYLLDLTKTIKVKKDASHIIKKLKDKGHNIFFITSRNNKECKGLEEFTLECKKQLEEYFEGTRSKFDLKYKLEGTKFQCNVWKELAKIPYGSLATYKEIAENIGNQKGVRAIANAIGRNNLAIIIPCHRVIGSNGKLTGFSAETDDKTGLELKKELLELEDSLCKMKKS